jgi:hypothetical protein
MRSASRAGFQRSSNHMLHVGIHNLPGSPGPRLIKQAIQAIGGEPPSPFSHGLWSYTEGCRHRKVRLSTGTCQDNTGTLRQRLCGFATVHPTFQRFTFFGHQIEWRERTPCSHGYSPFSTHYIQCPQLIQ